MGSEMRSPWRQDPNRLRPAGQPISLSWSASTPRCFGAVALAAYQAFAPTAHAQTWRVEPSITTTATLTSNSGFANAATTDRDIILELVPRIALTGRGARFKFDAFAEADSITYIDKTVADEVIPKARMTLNTTAIERWLYLDAAAGFQQVAARPYSPVSNGSLPAFRLDSAQYRLSPFIDHAFSPTVSLQARNDNIWTHQRADLSAIDPRRNTYSQVNRFVFEQRPVPLGYALEANQERTRYANSSIATLDLKSARGVLTYAIDPTLILGVVGGREHSEFAGGNSDDSIRGVRLRWRPSERTDLNASLERRFFDKAWDIVFSHRSPFMAMGFTLNRQPSSQPSSFLIPTLNGDFRTLVDAAYTTRYPNPAERAVVVNNAIAALGASASSAGPNEVFSDYAQVQQRAAASVAFLSPRSALTFQVFTLKAEQLQRVAQSPLPPLSADTMQLGGSVAFNRRLTSTLSVETSLNGAKIEGIGVSQGLASSSKSARLTLSQALSPKTQLITGARRQIVKSTVVQPTQETAVFIGLGHRF